MILRYDGSGWQKMDSGTSAYLMSIWGNSWNNVFAAGTGGTVLRYNGALWNKTDTGTWRDIYGIWGNSAGTEVFAVGRGGTILRYSPASQLASSK